MRGAQGKLRPLLFAAAASLSRSRLRATQEDGGDDEDEDEDEDEDDYDKCLGWKVEYAKSGRSACTKCAQKIENKALRLGRLEPNPYSDSGTVRLPPKAFFFKR